MQNRGVRIRESLDQMISDLSDFSASGSLSGLTPEKRRDLLDRVCARIDDEPARVSTDTQGRITAVNPAFIGLCGHAFEDLKGRTPGSMLQGPETCPKSVALLREAIRQRVPVTTELVNYHKDWTTYRVRIDLKPLFDASGRHIGFEAEERTLPQD